MRRNSIGLVAVLLLGTGFLRAQQPGPDPLRDALFPPELVMQNQRAIGLSEKQKTSIRADVEAAQARFTDLQWKMQDEMEKMVSLVKQPRVDEKQTLDQLDKILTIEREVKRTQITLLVRIKNELTSEQQGKLEALRNQSGSR